LAALSEEVARDEGYDSLSVSPSDEGCRGDSTLRSSLSATVPLSKGLLTVRAAGVSISEDVEISSPGRELLLPLIVFVDSPRGSIVGRVEEEEGGNEFQSSELWLKCIMAEVIS
jgi:hypothetical protein